MDLYTLGTYFHPQILVGYLSGNSMAFILIRLDTIAFIIEAAKWCIVLIIVLWLSLAQLAARHHNKNTIAVSPTP